MRHLSPPLCAAFAVVVLACACSKNVDETPPSPPTQGTEKATSKSAPTVSEPDDSAHAPRTKRREQTPPNPEPGDLVQVREFYENGQLYTERTERVLDNRQRVRLGPMRAWWEDGKPRIEGGYDDAGRLTGTWRYYFESGGIEREGAFETGKHSGVWIEYWPNGKQRYEGFYHVGLREGFWQTWHENGQLESEGEYSNNQRVGPWKYFLPDGKPDPAQTGAYAGNVKEE